MEFAADFKALLSSIEPGEDHVADAKAAHETVRDQLRKDDEFKDAHKDTFLSGSYARHTAINDINDVDVICLVDIDHAITEPEVVLAWTQSILGKYYKKTKRQGRSIGVQAANDVWVDLVPAASQNGDNGPLWIPDREAKEWVGTHPKGQIKAATDKNKAIDGYYVHVVKLLKFWRDHLPTESCRPKSYILESIVHRSVGYPSSHAAGIVSVLEGTESSFGWYRGMNTVPTISDPGYSVVNVAKHWPANEFNDFMVQVKTAAGTARNALASKDESESRKLWRKLFGATFGA
ncbi:MAG: SMODS domain-containing nucleotidyltransferase [Planctomycetota bacterium]